MNSTISAQIVGLQTAIPQSRMAESVFLSVMKKSILIIDEDQPGRRALRRLLENHAFDCNETDDGLEGLALLDAGLTVDVILSDYHTPGINGVNFLKALSYRVSGKGVPVILLSSNLSKEMEHVGKQAGALAVMAKPYDTQKLLETIGLACRRPKS